MVQTHSSSVPYQKDDIFSYSLASNITGVSISRFANGGYFRLITNLKTPGNLGEMNLTISVLETTSTLLKNFTGITIAAQNREAPGVSVASLNVTSLVSASITNFGYSLLVLETQLKSTRGLAFSYDEYYKDRIQLIHNRFEVL